MTKLFDCYGVFLMAQLAVLTGDIEDELECDLWWEQAHVLYQQFTESEYNSPNKGEYDCIVDFLGSLM